VNLFDIVVFRASADGRWLNKNAAGLGASGPLFFMSRATRRAAILTSILVPT